MSDLVIRDSLKAIDLEAFTRGEILILVVKRFLTSDFNEPIAKIINSEAREEYSYITVKNGVKKVIPFGVSRIGVPFSTSFGKECIKNLTTPSFENFLIWISSNVTPPVQERLDSSSFKLGKS